MTENAFCQCCVLFTSYLIKLVTKTGKQKIKTENLALAYLVDHVIPRYYFISDLIERAASGGKRWNRQRSFHLCFASLYTVNTTVNLLHFTTDWSDLSSLVPPQFVFFSTSSTCERTRQHALARSRLRWHTDTSTTNVGSHTLEWSLTLITAPGKHSSELL